MAAKGPRENITLECTECKRRNYTTSKNKRNNTDRLEVAKYCKYCKKIYDIEDVKENEFRERLEKENNIQIDSTKVVFEGICKNCL